MYTEEISSTVAHTLSHSNIPPPHTDPDTVLLIRWWSALPLTLISNFYMRVHLLSFLNTFAIGWKQCWGSVTFWCRSESPDPYLWLMDPDPDRIRLLSSVTLKMTKKIFFSYFLFTGTLSDLKIWFFAKILCKNFILQELFQSSQHIYEKREGSGARSGSGSRAVPLNTGSGSGRPKNMRIQIPNTGWKACIPCNTDFSSPEVVGLPGRGTIPWGPTAVPLPPLWREEKGLRSRGRHRQDRLQDIVKALRDKTQDAFKVRTIRYSDVLKPVRYCGSVSFWASWIRTLSLFVRIRICLRILLLFCNFFVTF